MKLTKLLLEGIDFNERMQIEQVFSVTFKLDIAVLSGLKIKSVGKGRRMC